MANKIFIATSLDGYIADKDGGIDWLTDLPGPTSGDGGFSQFMESIDAIVMGRKTFEKVLSFKIDWPYSKKVFVWTKSRELIPIELQGKAEIISGSVPEVLQ
ncbi:MAG: dihydrofolate reductase family protein, partial [Bdellovibrionales bacterium]